MHALKKECETRWGSAFECIERFLEQETAIRKVQTTDYNFTHLLPTGEQLSVLRAVVDGPRPASDLTDRLSGNYDTSQNLG